MLLFTDLTFPADTSRPNGNIDLAEQRVLQDVWQLRVRHQALGLAGLWLFGHRVYLAKICMNIEICKYKEWQGRSETAVATISSLKLEKYQTLCYSFHIQVYYLYLQMMERMTMNTTQMEIVTKRTRNPDMRVEFYHWSEIIGKVVIKSHLQVRITICPGLLHVTMTVWHPMTTSVFVTSWYIAWQYKLLKAHLLYFLLETWGNIMLEFFCCIQSVW